MIHIYKTMEEVTKNLEKYNQCKACLNPVDKRHAVDGCPTCGSQYFVPEEEKDFSHLKDVLPPDMELEV
jgi:rRNA maturation endonuclease Nob1